MHFRIALIVLSVGTLSATGALVACSSSSTGTTTTTTHDSGTTTSAHDSGHVSDAGTSSTGFTDADFAACTASSTAPCGLQTRCNPAAQSTDYGDAGSCITRQFLACKDDFLAPNTAVSAPSILPPPPSPSGLGPSAGWPITRAFSTSAPAVTAASSA